MPVEPELLACASPGRAELNRNKKKKARGSEEMATRASPVPHPLRNGRVVRSLAWCVSHNAHGQRCTITPRHVRRRSWWERESGLPCTIFPVMTAATAIARHAGLTAGSCISLWTGHDSAPRDHRKKERRRPMHRRRSKRQNRRSPRARRKRERARQHRVC